MILQGAIVSVFYIGALAGALLSGPLSDLAGRKVTVVAGASLCAVGGALQASSFQLWSDWFENVVAANHNIMLHEILHHQDAFSRKSDQRNGSRVWCVFCFGNWPLILCTLL